MDEINLYKKKYLKYRYKYKKIKDIYEKILLKSNNIGSGSNGIIYYPKLPFLVKNEFFNIAKSKKIYDEVGKIFIDNNNYKNELNGYKNIIEKYKIDDKYFNMPISYGIVSNQITFKKGNDITYDNIKNIYIKFINILDCVNYLNTNNFLFDDLKLSNMIEVDNIYKIIDFSSIISFSDINYKIFMNSYLETSYYISYSSYLNKLLKYYLLKNNGINLKVESLIEELKEELNDNESIESINYIIDIPYEINKKFSLNDIIFEQNIDFKKNYNLEYENENNESKLKINFSNLHDILFFYINKEDNEFHNIYKNYFEYFIKYYDELYGDNIELILIDIMKRINLYSLGITIFTLIKSKIKDINIIKRKNVNIIKSLIKMAILLVFNIYILKSKIYIMEPTMDKVFDIYNSINKYL